jgi:hypothetical protein
MKYRKPKIKIKSVDLPLFFSGARIINSRRDLLASATDCAPQCYGDCDCFYPGTKILMGNRQAKEIQQITPGNSVLTYDLIHNKPVKRYVKKLHVHENGPWKCLTINNILRLTDNHPVWMNNKSWKKAGKLKVGDMLLNSDGKSIMIKSIKRIESSTKVYSLSISEPEHSYFAEDILVHNREPLPCDC